MSQILNNPASPLYLRNDGRAMLAQLQENEPDEDYSTPWWPSGRGMIGDQSTDVAILKAVWYEDPELTRGISARLGLVGVTRDQYGSPLGGAAVRTFRTSDGALIHETVSDANGSFVGSTYDGAAHFLVFYKAGVPDVFGTTVNTLVGS